LIHTPNDSTPTETANTFSTVLIRKNNQWKIDYRQTSSNLSKNPFAGFFRSLQNLGDKLNKQLEQAIPKIEQELESFGSKLERQMDEFNNELEKSFPTQPDDQKPDSI
jgi:exonuclease VII large subunit